ncbi:MAG: 7-dehydrocholesterol reductase [Myxococcota bacterium]|jgi:7-dehydrocholesterol reductase
MRGELIQGSLPGLKHVLERVSFYHFSCHSPDFQYGGRDMANLRAANPSEGGLEGFVRRTLVPLFLLLVCPPAALVFWHVNKVHLGSFAAFGGEIADKGFFSAIGSAWEPVMFGTPEAWAIIAVFSAFQLLLIRVVPGKEYRGPETPGGHVPVYVDNGMRSFVITMATFGGLSWGLGLFHPAIVWHHFGGLIGALNVLALVVCLALYFKGRFAPSGPDHSHTGNFIFDYYWGTELYPRVLGFDVKQFTNCRFGMMGWPVILVSFAAAQGELTGSISDAMLVSVGIQLVYIAKFFWWETGYLASMDIQVDRAGYYICWGCLVWVPAIYTSHTCYMVQNPHTFGPVVATLIFLAGVAAVFMNYFADAQRQRVRATDGQTTVWGRKPDLIRAEYTTEKGEQRSSLLLVSGFWGVSRHFHYLPEITASFCWTLPALFDNFLPWFYVIFLTVLLVHRAFRDEQKCSRKYGEYWVEYKRRVPYKIIPGVL